MDHKYGSKRHNVTGEDMLRVERKLNSALNDRIHSKAENYTQAKIRSLQNFLEDADKQTERQTATKDKYRRDPTLLLQKTEEKYMSGLDNMKRKGQQLEIELKESQKTVEALKEVLKRERTEREQFLDTIEQEHSQEVESRTQKYEVSISIFITRGKHQKTAGNDRKVTP